MLIHRIAHFSLVALVRRLRRAMFDPYRPELHYMRGPGPKWREKHGLSETPVALESLVESPA